MRCIRVITAALLLGLTLGAEEIQDKIGASHPDQLVESPNIDIEKKEIQDRREVYIPNQHKRQQQSVQGNYGSQGSSSKQEPLSIPVPLPIPISSGHVILPSAKIQSNQKAPSQGHHDQQSQKNQGHHDWQGQQSQKVERPGPSHHERPNQQNRPHGGHRIRPIKVHLVQVPHDNQALPTRHRLHGPHGYHDNQEYQIQESHDYQSGQVHQNFDGVPFQGHQISQNNQHSGNRGHQNLASDHHEQSYGNPSENKFQEEQNHHIIQGHPFQHQGHDSQNYQELQVHEHHQGPEHQEYQAIDHDPPHPVYPGGGEASEYESYAQDPQNNQFQGFQNLPGTDHWPLPQPEMPKIVHLDVKCEKNFMKVAIEFDKPFHGIIFSKGHYSYGSCIHVPAGSGHTTVFFDVSINSCGTHGDTQNGIYGHGAHNSGGGTFFENTIVIQYDPQVQEVWDQARKLRCSWHDQYEKSVTFRPFPVDMLNVVRADFAGDNVGCWMQIQVGKGPWASEVSGIVKIGQTMTMVLAIKDEENKFDMMVRNCIAHDGKRSPIELVDSRGCVVRPKIMSRFTKIKNFGSSASVLSFAHFQAFKFPDSMEVHFQCTIQICRPQCPEQCANTVNSGHLLHDAYPSVAYGSVGRPREERDVSSAIREVKEIGLNRVIRVVSTGDLAFAMQINDTVPIHQVQEQEFKDLICMSTSGFAGSLVVLLAVLVISCLVCAFLYLRQRSGQKIVGSSALVIKKKSKA